MTRRGRPLPAALAIAPEDAPPDSGPAGSPEEHQQREDDRGQEEAPRHDGEPFNEAEYVAAMRTLREEEKAAEGGPRVIAQRGDPTCDGFGADGDACALVPDHAPPCAGIDQAVSTENLPEAPRDDDEPQREPQRAFPDVGAGCCPEHVGPCSDGGIRDVEAGDGPVHNRERETYPAAIDERCNVLHSKHGVCYRRAGHVSYSKWHMSPDDLGRSDVSWQEEPGTPPSPASPPAQGTDAPASTEAAPFTPALLPCDGPGRGCGIAGCPRCSVTPDAGLYARMLAEMAEDGAAPAPTAAELTAAVVGAYADVDIAMAEAREAEERVIVRKDRLARAIDAKARSLGPGKLCSINGATLRATKPRKRKGQPEDASALWTLEPVEVGE